MPLPLFTVEQVREIDRLAVQSTPISGLDLMKRAGQVLFDEVLTMSAHKDAVHIFCGAGNNAGDGYVLAKLLLESGIQPLVYAVFDGAKLTADALCAFKEFSEIGRVTSVLPAELCSGVVVDALIGTGLSKPLSGEFLAAVDLINSARLATLAVDVPSGLNADTGYAEVGTVRADKTISFVALKQGLYTADGVTYAGDVMLNDLSVNEQVVSSQQAGAELLSLEALKKTFVPRAKNSHKGDYGHVLMVGGDSGYSGAIRLAGEAALRVGSGLVSIATRAKNAALISVARPELMCHRVDKRSELRQLAARCTVLGVGPGLAQTAWSHDLFEAALDLDIPLVLDADGLNLLAKQPYKKTHWVLTPHPAEAARLLNCTTAEVQQDRFSAVKKLQQQYGGVIVLKGAGSLVCGGDKVFVSAAGNPGMASGGMGDILTGVIAGLMAQGYSLIDAAKLGVTIHATAGDRAALAGEKGLLASDLMPYIRELMNEY